MISKDSAVKDLEDSLQMLCAKNFNLSCIDLEYKGFFHDIGKDG
ncbi:hypothetical protein [uncultured Treponema sp.]|nr:hypothetical protein [uncultured Treponema sp.]